MERDGTRLPRGGAVADVNFASEEVSANGRAGMQWLAGEKHSGHTFSEP